MRNPGAACAADLALAGHSVHFALFDPAPGALDAVRARGGFELEGDPVAYFSGRTGMAPFSRICDSASDAIDGAEAVDMPYAIVPLVRLAGQAGIGAPLHRATAEIFGTLLGIQPWACHPTLEDMALEGAGSTVARRFLFG